MRAIGLDIHRDFCEVAVVEDATVSSAGRIETSPAALELFATSLGPDDRVALEVSGHACEIARLIEPHVGQMLVVSPGDSGIRQASAKTTASTPGRLRSSCGRAPWIRCGSQTSQPASCGGGLRGEASSCVRARVRRTRFTPS